jgi:hypothetical protein
VKREDGLFGFELVLSLVDSMAKLVDRKRQACRLNIPVQILLHTTLCCCWSFLINIYIVPYLSDDWLQNRVETPFPIARMFN